MPRSVLEHDEAFMKNESFFENLRPPPRGSMISLLFLGFQNMTCGLHNPAHGFEETKASVANKLARATVAAAFFLAVLVAIGCENLYLEDI